MASVSIPGHTPRRAACDECRRRKVKCSGGVPACSRCLRDEIQCSYSAPMRTGRPRKSKLSGENTHDEDVGNASLDISLASTDPGKLEPSQGRPFAGYTNPYPDYLSSIDLSSIDSSPIDFSFLALPFFDILPAGGTIANTTVVNLPALRHENVPLGPLNLLTSPPRPSPGTELCNCLVNLSTSLQGLQGRQKMAFPADLYILRDVLGIATEVLGCQCCPSKYLSASTNTLLMCTLILSMADCYGKVILAIDEEAQVLADAPHHMKMLQVTPAATEVGTRVGESLNLEVDTTEWRNLARRMVKAEIFGAASQPLPSFMRLVESLEQRQKAWHARAPCDDFPKGHYNGQCEDGKPQCLTLVERARTLASSLYSIP